MSLIPVPEVRIMVEAAKKFVAGESHFSSLVGPTEQCLWWARVHGALPAIVTLAKEWQELADRVWNECGQHRTSLPVEEFRRRVAADLGMALDVVPSSTDRAEMTGGV
jgi:hypothetical protein